MSTEAPNVRVRRVTSPSEYPLARLTTDVPVVVAVVGPFFANHWVLSPWPIAVGTDGDLDWSDVLRASEATSLAFLHDEPDIYDEKDGEPL